MRQHRRYPRPGSFCRVIVLVSAFLLVLCMVISLIFLDSPWPGLTSRWCTLALFPFSGRRASTDSTGPYLWFSAVPRSAKVFHDNVSLMVDRQHHTQKRYAVPGDLHADTHQDESDHA